MEQAKKIWKKITDKTADHLLGILVSAVFAFIGGIVWAFWKDIKPWFNTDQSFTFPRWIWGLIVVAITVLPTLILTALTVRRKRDLLTDPKDTNRSLRNWIMDFMEDADGITNTIWYEAVDDECNLKPGTAKKDLAKYVNSHEKLGLKIRVVEKGPKTITLTFAEKQTKPDQSLLSDENDINNSLHYWLHDQINFLSQKKLTRWYFSTIDNKLKLAPGSAKKYLSEAIKNNISNFRIEIANEGEDTILVRYHPPPNNVILADFALL